MCQTKYLSFVLVSKILISMLKIERIRKIKIIIIIILKKIIIIEVYVLCACKCKIRWIETSQTFIIYEIILKVKKT
jgi:hypothetical protein